MGKAARVKNFGKKRSNPESDLPMVDLDPKSKLFKSVDSNQKLSRGQRQRKEKRERLLARLSLERTPQSKASKKKAEALSSLSTMEDMLPLPIPKGEDVTFKQPNKCLGTNQRKKLVSKELNNFSNVLAHPAFQSDPVSAILQHVQNTVPKREKAPSNKMET